MRTELRVLPTADLGCEGRRGLRALLDAAFTGFDEHAWDHALGGVHVLAGPPDAPVGHAAVVGRRIVHAGAALRTGYVEAVAVHPSAQGRGLGAEVMTTVGHLVRGGFRLGALGADGPAARLYRRLGWRTWTGPLAALTPHGVVDTPDRQGSVLVLAAGARLDPGLPLVCDWRDGELW